MGNQLRRSRTTSIESLFLDKKIITKKEEISKLAYTHLHMKKYDDPKNLCQGRCRMYFLRLSDFIAGFISFAKNKPI